jgi:hypothetical protein
MELIGHEPETFLLLNGLRVNRPIRLSDDVELLPVSAAPTRELLATVAKKGLDFAVTLIFAPSVGSQIRVRAESSKAVATLAWNSLWDTVLLSAFLKCEVICNLQSATPELIGPECQLSVTNYHLRGLPTAEPHVVTEEEAIWIEANIGNARRLLDKSAFRNAVHSLASYRWHSLPQARLALIWSGIEGIFDIDSEIVFRLSLYIARFLEPDDQEQRLGLFNEVKRLYKPRSQAVHGTSLRGDTGADVDASADLLWRLIRKCVETASLPQVSTLAP